MRGEDNKQEAMFSYVSPEKRVPTDPALRPIRAMVDGILKEMSPQFAKRYADVGRPSIAPERLFAGAAPNRKSAGAAPANNRSGAIDGRPTSAYRFANCGDISFRMPSTIARIGRSAG